MFELALNCDELNIFLVNLESSKLLDNKYFMIRVFKTLM